MTIERDLVQGAMVLPSQGSVSVTSISPAQVSPPAILRLKYMVAGMESNNVNEKWLKILGKTHHLCKDECQCLTKKYIPVTISLVSEIQLLVR